MITLNLKNIVLKKDFSPVKMGISATELTKHLGKPDNIYDNNFGSVIYFYGGYEFAFFDNKLHYFQNDNISHNWIEFENKHFKMDTWLFKNSTKISLKNFICELEKENIEYDLNEFNSENEEGNYTLIKLFNRVKVEFNSNKILYAIRYEDFEQE